MPKTSSIHPEEIARFAKHAAGWWDENGPHRPLHLMRPLRLQYLEAQCQKHLGKGLAGLRVLDVGCGAGLMSEALAQKGARVTGLDAAAELIDAARAHGKGVAGLAYRHGAIEDVAKEKQKFDLVMALEVIEHVNDPAGFVKNCAAAMDKNALLVFSTPNRTPKSMLFTIIGAEYVLRWIPLGTHQYSKFIRPSELSNMVKDTGLTVRDICGLVFNPLTGRFSLEPGDVDVDYFLTATN